MLEDFSLFADLMCLNKGLGLFERMVEEKESLVAASVSSIPSSKLSMCCSHGNILVS